MYLPHLIAAERYLRAFNQVVYFAGNYSYFPLQLLDVRVTNFMWNHVESLN